MSIRRHWVGVFVALLIVLLGWGYWKFRQPRFVAGQRIPDFTVTLADGRAVPFAQWRGQYVLIHFWGSWCGPCRAENRELRRLYSQYRDSKFDIISIGIEQTRYAWEQAIQTDGLIWPHHALELERFKGPLADFFNVRAIPTTFLVNPEGVIMGVNLSVPQLERMLTEAFEVK